MDIPLTFYRFRFCANTVICSRLFIDLESRGGIFLIGTWCPVSHGFLCSFVECRWVVGPYRYLRLIWYKTYNLGPERHVYVLKARPV